MDIFLFLMNKDIVYQNAPLNYTKKKNSSNKTIKKLMT